MYSPNYQKLFDKRYREQRTLAGPIAGRTRSCTKKTEVTTAPTSAENGSTAPYVPRIVTGTIVKWRSSRLALERSDRKLRNTRSKLRRHLSIFPDFRDRYGDLRNSARQIIRQLSDLAPDGALGTIPRPQLARWDSDERMQNRRVRLGKSARNRMDEYWTKKELDDEFGILDAEKTTLRDGEFDFGTYLDGEHDLAEKERTMDEVETRRRRRDMEGIWRKLSALAGRDLARVCRWAMRREASLLRVSRDAVMDERCMGIVRRVCEMAQVVE